MADKNSVPVSIGPALESDLAAILTLLTESGLPPEGLSEHLPTTLVARTGQMVIGCAALEPYGKAALLRSVAVTPAYRGQCLGQRLTRATLALARQQGMARIYLLTETAANFFPKFGFRPVERVAVPSAVQGSLEFTSL